MSELDDKSLTLDNVTMSSGPASHHEEYFQVIVEGRDLQLQVGHAM